MRSQSFRSETSVPMIASAHEHSCPLQFWLHTHDFSTTNVVVMVNFPGRGAKIDSP